MGKKKAFIAMLTIMVLTIPILSACVDTEEPAEEATEKRPTIVSVVPAANARDVSLTTTITIVFDKPMYNSAVAHKAFSFNPEVSIDNLQSHWLDNSTLEIESLSLELDARYTITLQSPELGELKDSEGTYGETGYRWSFTTIARPVFDLPDAVEQGLITAKFQGWSRSVVIIELANLTGSEMEISVPKGLILQSSIADKANMVLEDVGGVISSISRGYLSTINYSSTSKIVLDPAEEKKYLLSVYSLESHKNNPGYNTMLSMGEVDPNMQNILSILEVLPSGTSFPDSVQTAIWVYTDNISKTELDDLLTLREKYILNARTILQEAGVDISSKRLFAQGISLLTAKMKENRDDDRLLIYVNEVREANKISFSSPSAGNKYLILDIVVKNKTVSPISLDDYDFTLVTANNYMYWSTYKTQDLEYPFAEVETLPSGDIYRGEIAFEIPVGAGETTLWYEDGTSQGRVKLIESPVPDPIPLSEYAPSNSIGDDVVADDLAIRVNSKRMASVLDERQAKDGWQFLILDITVENISSKNVSYYTFHFFVQDEYGYLFERHWASSSLPNAFESGDLEPGEIYQGGMVFEVPQASTAFEMWYSEYGVFVTIEL